MTKRHRVKKQVMGDRQEKPETSFEQNFSRLMPERMDAVVASTLVMNLTPTDEERNAVAASIEMHQASGVPTAGIAQMVWTQVAGHIALKMQRGAYLQAIAMLPELEKKASACNDGRGISCVRILIDSLKYGSFNDAEAVAVNENDKLRSYPEVRGIIRKMLPKYHSFLERMEKSFGKDTI